MQLQDHNRFLRGNHPYPSRRLELSEVQSSQPIGWPVCVGLSAAFLLGNLTVEKYVWPKICYTHFRSNKRAVSTLPK